MATWSQFTAAAPALAAGIRALLQQYGPGLAYLATVRPDGGPRLHPVSPVITADGLHCFVVPSPKRRDLERDGRYALHAYPPEQTDDEACLTGRATPVTDALVISRLADQLHAAPQVEWRLFELSVETAMLRRHGTGGALPLTPAVPAVTRSWRDPTPHPARPLAGAAV